MHIYDKIIGKPKDIKTEHLNQICDIVKKGGQIKGDVKKGIYNADLIAYTLKDERVICTATLKNPNTSYKTKVFNSAGVNTDIDYKKELGYIVTHPDFEGKKHCQDLLKYFFPKISNNTIYATTRKDSMIHILEKFGFKRTGEIYKDDLRLLLFTQKMLFEDNVQP